MLMNEYFGDNSLEFPSCSCTELLRCLKNYAEFLDGPPSTSEPTIFKAVSNNFGVGKYEITSQVAWTRLITYKFLRVFKSQESGTFKIVTLFSLVRITRKILANEVA